MGSNKEDRPSSDAPVEIKINRSIRGNALRSQSNEEPTRRDPRFDPRCSGSNDVRHFVKNYSFLDDIRRDEIGELQRALRKAKDSNEKSKIKNTIARLRNKMVERNNKVRQLDVIKEMKASKKVEGSKFANIKKSDIKKSLIVSKYKELKESGKLKKYLERKRKKLIQRDGKSFE